MKQIILNKPEDVCQYTSNLLTIMALANLKAFGIYRCKIGGKKTVFKIREVKCS